jgi:hypothetical protein
LVAALSPQPLRKAFIAEFLRAASAYGVKESKTGLHVYTDAPACA